ncbi:MAG: hypothetical protein RR475_02395 [Clostridia bacterium]
MTIGGWIVVLIFAVPALLGGLYIAFVWCNGAAAKFLTMMITALLIAGMFACGFWYFRNTASGQRSIIDQKSNLSGGVERTVTIYTANGDVLATYQGKIDIESNDGGYIKFVFDGNRYIYYNCFVETIAEID